jgi:ribosomal protein L12E/L44/L45/RPP1/RPP2
MAGIKSLTYDDEKSTLTVVGEVDVVEIVAALRKAKHPAEVVSVTDEKKEAEEKKKKEEEEKKKKEAEEKKKKEEEEKKKKCCCPSPCPKCPPKPCLPLCPPPACPPPPCPPPYMKPCQPCYIPIEDEYPGPCTIV